MLQDKIILVGESAYKYMMLKEYLLRDLLGIRPDQSIDNVKDVFKTKLDAFLPIIPYDYIIARPHIIPLYDVAVSVESLIILYYMNKNTEAGKLAERMLSAYGEDERLIQVIRQIKKFSRTGLRFRDPALERRVISNKEEEGYQEIPLAFYMTQDNIAMNISVLYLRTPHIKERNMYVMASDRDESRSILSVVVNGTVRKEIECVDNTKELCERLSRFLTKVHMQIMYALPYLDGFIRELEERSGPKVG